ETVSGDKFDVDGHFAPECVAGASGSALRFDGYTSSVEAALGDILPAGAKTMTVSMWVALPSYPIIQLDTDTSEQTAIATCLDTDAKTGFGFYLGFDGKYSFRTYVGGWPVTVEVAEPLPTYCWNNLTAVVDCDNRAVRLYRNGAEVGSGRASGTISFSPGAFYMGMSPESRMYGPFELMAFNGLIDDITVWDEAVGAADIQTWTTEAVPDLDIPASRFAEDMLRPRFHGMPAAAWTNECHGLWYAEGRYHLFFQKNADGPYMARLHWGHISSENLYDWREERIALAPGEPYDIKGCWSGCVFADDVVTGGKPNIIYTAVDYVKASIAQAVPATDDLDCWTKPAFNPIIAGRPEGLSDDFRDPYFFRHGEDAYIIVGSSKNGVGTTTLHRYNAVSGTWSDTGRQFFSGTSAARDGRFWEMPNVTPMADGKWLFTATPLETAQGVRTLYWTGSIAADGTFVPDAASAAPRMVELTSKDGFGLLSPTVYNHDGRTIVLGIVPDKLPAQTNWNLGWAHCYSLPRQWSLSAADGSLVQKPVDELAGLRGATAFSRSAFALADAMPLGDVKGRELEVLAEFEVGSATFGLSFFKGAGSEARITYNPATGVLEADFSGLRRLVNDSGSYDGVYRCTLPEKPAAGSTMKINVFVDHSIVDIFVNDRYATSVRVFPTEHADTDVEVFADNGAVAVRSLDAWVLDNHGGLGGIAGAVADSRDGLVDVYTTAGIRLKSGVDRSRALDGLESGLYLVGSEKIFVP
ncbi:MAG: GH32 C-terminal domain-containing protein, partial [Muribaculaceae bacterium]|nr:GH32 C-terminal domain-containing protein [Muribaculaceae bacterium]